MNAKNTITALCSLLIYTSSAGMLRTSSPAFELTQSSLSNSIGNLTVITGPMACGKTEELMRIIRVLQVAQRNVYVCKHSLDTRSAKILCSRGRPNEEIEAKPIEEPESILEYFQSNPFAYFAFDEIQFAQKKMNAVIQALLDRGTRVIVSGLDKDFKKEPFGECMPYLLSIADEVIKLKAVCSVCKEWNATLTQRLVDGKPVRRNDPLIVVDDGTKHNVVYEPRCRKCHELPE